MLSNAKHLRPERKKKRFFAEFTLSEVEGPQNDKVK
jgi:hypothetical protein